MSISSAITSFTRSFGAGQARDASAPQAVSAAQEDASEELAPLVEAARSLAHGTPLDMGVPTQAAINAASSKRHRWFATSALAAPVANALVGATGYACGTDLPFTSTLGIVVGSALLLSVQALAIYKAQQPIAGPGRWPTLDKVYGPAITAAGSAGSAGYFVGAGSDDSASDKRAQNVLVASMVVVAVLGTGTSILNTLAKMYDAKSDDYLRRAESFERVREGLASLTADDAEGVEDALIDAVLA